MEVLKAEINWMEEWANEPGLYLLLKDCPKHEELKYEERNSCFFAEKDGLIEFFHYKQPGDGYAGRHFNITMQDGSHKVLKGPWSSRASVMNKQGFTPCIEAAITENPEVWEKGYTFYSSAVTVKLAEKALKLINESIHLPFWPEVELRKKEDGNGEINYHIREIGKTLEQSKEERKETK